MIMTEQSSSVQATHPLIVYVFPSSLVAEQPGVARFWTQDQDEMLRKMVREGHSNVAIASAIGRPLDMVIARRSVIGLPAEKASVAAASSASSGNWSQSEDHTLCSLVYQGYNDADIADLLGLPEQKVIDRIVLLKLRKTRRLPGVNRSWTVSEENRLRDLVAQRLANHQIGRILGRTTTSIVQKRFKLGIKRPRRSMAMSNGMRFKARPVSEAGQPGDATAAAAAAAAMMHNVAVRPVALSDEDDDEDMSASDRQYGSE